MGGGEEHIPRGWSRPRMAGASASAQVASIITAVSKKPAPRMYAPIADSWCSA